MDHKQFWMRLLQKVMSSTETTLLVHQFVRFSHLFFFSQFFSQLLLFFFSQTNKQKLVLIAVLTGTVLPTSKTLEEVLREGLLHPGDPILLDTDDILSD